MVKRSKGWPSLSLIIFLLFMQSGCEKLFPPAPPSPETPPSTPPQT